MTFVVTCLVTDTLGNILLVRHYRRGWELPQGRVESGETLEEAVHREVLEETGTTVELGPLAAIWKKACDPPATIYGYLASYRCGNLATSAETPDVRWFTPEQALALIRHEINRDRLTTLTAHNSQVVHVTYRTRPFTIINSTGTFDSAEAHTGLNPPSISE